MSRRTVASVRRAMNRTGRNPFHERPTYMGAYRYPAGETVAVGGETRCKYCGLPPSNHSIYEMEDLYNEAKEYAERAFRGNVNKSVVYSTLVQQETDRFYAVVTPPESPDYATVHFKVIPHCIVAEIGHIVEEAQLNVQDSAAEAQLFGRPANLVRHTIEDVSQGGGAAAPEPENKYPAGRTLFVNGSEVCKYCGIPGCFTQRGNISYRQIAATGVSVRHCIDVLEDLVDSEAAHYYERVKKHPQSFSFKTGQFKVVPHCMALEAQDAVETEYDQIQT